MHIHVFHHTDVDGIMSAVLFALGFRNEAGRYNYFTFTPVDYNTTWQEEKLTVPDKSDAIAVVDFMYHSEAEYWFDHHQTGLGKFTLSKINFKGAYVPSSHSCCQVIFDTFPSLKVFSFFKKLVEEVNMVDSALYPNPEYIYKGQSFGVKFRLALLSKKSNSLYEELINLFIEDSTALVKLVEYNQLPDILDYRYLKTVSRIERSFEVFKSIAKKNHQVVYYDSTTLDNEFFDRYFSYRYDPQTHYTIYITKTKSNMFSVAVSRNPWMDESNGLINVGELCSRYGGGGHAGAGGIACDTYEQASLIFEAVKKYLFDISTEN
jgi:oligoribonuclease NrnB/cAMP/cGMP phosphodiesterase (DHH superfamily)